MQKDSERSDKLNHKVRKYEIPYEEWMTKNHFIKICNKEGMIFEDRTVNKCSEEPKSFS